MQPEMPECGVARRWVWGCRGQGLGSALEALLCRSQDLVLGSDYQRESRWW